MVSLKDLQHGMADMITGNIAPDFLTSEICADTLGALERLQVHKNTYSQSLTSALEGVFPLVGVLVGQDFLRQALQRFVMQNPPAKPMLYSYGEGFSAYLRDMDMLQSMPYVADVAALEWETHALMHSREIPHGGDNGSWSDGPVWNPNARYIASDYPLFDLWRAATGQIEPEQVDMEAPGQSVLMVLHEGEVLYQPIDDRHIHEALSQMTSGQPLRGLEPELVNDLIGRGAIWNSDG